MCGTSTTTKTITTARLRTTSGRPRDLRLYFNKHEIGTHAEEHLAFLTESGMDMEDHEACDFASEVIQAEQEAYFARKGAQTKKAWRLPGRSLWMTRQLGYRL